ncbi:hypothetical protein C0J52_12541 [Blattella germanica]|nr:hypothetical protein C0J52_12541 [Blattella germanica]
MRWKKEDETMGEVYNAIRQIGLNKIKKIEMDGSYTYVQRMSQDRVVKKILDRNMEVEREEDPDLDG